MPVKNCERFISESIRSVLSQTFTDFELLVVDDGSSDTTISIISQFRSDARLKVLRNAGAGLVDALNHGVACASGELIARMDADDVCLPDRLRRQCMFLSDHPDVAAVGTQVRFIDEHGAPTAEKMSLPESPEAIARMLLKGCCVRHPTVLMRKAALQEIGGYRNHLVYAEDYDLWLRMSERYPLANLSDALVLYRVHAAQVSELKEWSQRLSRNLALLAALKRRQGREDPIGHYFCFEKGAPRQRCRGLGCPNCVCESVRAFDHAERVLFEPEALLSRDDVRDTLRYISRHPVGDGQKSRQRVLVALCRHAARRRTPIEFIKTLALSLRIHPGRTLRWLVMANK